jgi:hypothetical protein
MAPIDDALAAIKSLESGENFTHQAIADKYGVSRCTLSRRHRGCQHDANAKNQAQNKLNPQQEAELIQYVNDLTKKALPPTRDMIRNFASKIAAAPVGDSWGEALFEQKHHQPCLQMDYLYGSHTPRSRLET